MKKRGRRGFDEQFRREAMSLAESGRMPLAQVARDLGIHLKTPRSWCRKARAAADFPGEETETLEQENRRVAPGECAAARGARDPKKSDGEFNRWMQQWTRAVLRVS